MASSSKLQKRAASSILRSWQKKELREGSRLPRNQIEEDYVLNPRNNASDAVKAGLVDARRRGLLRFDSSGKYDERIRSPPRGQSSRGQTDSSSDRASNRRARPRHSRSPVRRSGTGRNDFSSYRRNDERRRSRSRFGRLSPERYHSSREFNGSFRSGYSQRRSVSRERGNRSRDRRRDQDSRRDRDSRRSRSRHGEQSSRRGQPSLDSSRSYRPNYDQRRSRSLERRNTNRDFHSHGLGRSSNHREAHVQCRGRASYEGTAVSRSPRRTTPHARSRRSRSRDRHERNYSVSPQLRHDSRRHRSRSRSRRRSSREAGQNNRSPVPDRNRHVPDDQSHRECDTTAPLRDGTPRFDENSFPQASTEDEPAGNELAFSEGERDFDATTLTQTGQNDEDHHKRQLSSGEASQAKKHQPNASGGQTESCQMNAVSEAGRLENERVKSVAKQTANLDAYLQHFEDSSDDSISDRSDICVEVLLELGQHARSLSSANPRTRGPFSEPINVKQTTFTGDVPVGLTFTHATIIDPLSEDGWADDAIIEWKCDFLRVEIRERGLTNYIAHPSDIHLFVQRTDDQGVLERSNFESVQILQEKIDHVQREHAQGRLNNLPTNEIASLFPMADMPNDTTCIFIPYNVGNRHWVLICCRFNTDKSQWSVQLFDSGTTNLELYIGAEVHALLKLVRMRPGLSLPVGEWTYLDSRPSRKQANGKDCGFFMCRALEELVLGTGENGTENDLEESHPTEMQHFGQQLRLTTLLKLREAAFPEKYPDPNCTTRTLESRSFESAIVDSEGESSDQAKDYSVFFDVRQYLCNLMATMPTKEWLRAELHSAIVAEAKIEAAKRDISLEGLEQNLHKRADFILAKSTMMFRRSSKEQKFSLLTGLGRLVDTRSQQAFLSPPDEQIALPDPIDRPIDVLVSIVRASGPTTNINGPATMQQRARDQAYLSASRFGALPLEPREAMSAQQIIQNRLNGKMSWVSYTYIASSTEPWLKKFKGQRAAADSVGRMLRELNKQTAPQCNVALVIGGVDGGSTDNETWSHLQHLFPNLRIGVLLYLQRFRLWHPDFFIADHDRSLLWAWFDVDKLAGLYSGRSEPSDGIDICHSRFLQACTLVSCFKQDHGLAGDREKDAGMAPLRQNRVASRVLTSPGRKTFPLPTDTEQECEVCGICVTIDVEQQAEVGPMSDGHAQCANVPAKLPARFIRGFSSPVALRCAHHPRDDEPLEDARELTESSSIARPEIADLVSLWAPNEDHRDASRALPVWVVQSNDAVHTTDATRPTRSTRSKALIRTQETSPKPGQTSEIAVKEGVRKFACPLKDKGCKQVFTFKASATYHARTSCPFKSEPAQRFDCPNKCGQNFATMNSAKRHASRNCSSKSGGATRYNCPNNCGLDFASIDAAKRHASSKSCSGAGESTRYYCPNRSNGCDMTFARLDTANRHSESSCRYK